MCEQSHLAHATDDINYQCAEERQTLNLVATLGIKPIREGNQWCFLYGDEHTGPCGFGNSVNDAALDFTKAWYKDDTIKQANK